eukprot:scaffold18104_cov80-Skeletonema_marinoi.AAC.2
MRTTSSFWKALELLYRSRGVWRPNIDFSQTASVKKGLQRHMAAMDSLYFATADDHNVLGNGKSNSNSSYCVVLDARHTVDNGFKTILRPKRTQTYSTKTHRM